MSREIKPSHQHIDVCTSTNGIDIIEGELWFDGWYSIMVLILDGNSEHVTHV